MFKRFAAAFVIGLLLQTLSIVQPAYGKSKVEQQARLTEKVRAGVAKLGTGQDAHIAVKLRDKTKLKGYISEVKDAS